MTQLTPLQEALAPKSEQLAGDDLIAGPRTIKITEARVIDGERKEKKLSIRFEGDNGKPFKPCKTMGRAMILAWKVTDEGPDLPQMVGKSITVFRDPDVDFGTDKGVGGVRISHMSHITAPAVMKLQTSKGKRTPYTFLPLTAEVRQIAQSTEDPARRLADQYIGKVRQAPDADALEGFAAKQADKFNRLPEALRMECLNALDQRRADFRALANGGTLSDENPAATEGPDDAEHGDQFAD